MLFHNQLRLIAILLLLGSCVAGFWLDPPGLFLAGIKYMIIVGATVLLEIIVLVILGIYYRYVPSQEPKETPSSTILDTPSHRSPYYQPVSRTIYCFQTAVGVLLIGSMLCLGGAYLLYKGM